LFLFAHFANKKIATMIYDVRINAINIVKKKSSLDFVVLLVKKKSQLANFLNS